MKMNYIELLRVPKANWNYDLYLYYFNFNGITYANNNYLIGTFKGTGDYIYPFKTEPDKGTRRPDYLYLMPFDETRYCFASVNAGTSNTGYVKTYKYVWVDDTPDYNDLWSYTLGDSLYVNSNSTTSHIYHLNDNSYNLILDRAIKTTTWEQGIWLVRMNGSDYISSKMLIPYVAFNPAYYPPGVEGRYFAFQDTDNYLLLCTAKQDSIIAKIRFQRATDIDFVNIVEDRLVDFTFNQSSFSKDAGTAYTIYETFFYGHPDYYVRVRYEDLFGNGGPWSRTVLWRTQDSASATFNEEWLFTGHAYTYTLGGGIQGFRNVDSKMVGIIKEIDETYQDGTYMSSLTNYYIYVFDQDGNFIQKVGLPGDFNDTNYLYVSNKKLFISYNDRNTWQPRLLIYDVDTNTYSVDVINLPPEYSSVYYTAFYKNNVYYVAYLADYSGADIVCYNTSSKTLEKVDLPNNINYSLISQSYQDDGFWFNFDDGTYVGVAFAYLSEEQKAMAFNFNQFIQNFIRR
jgi:hypothetical protein